MRAPPHPCPTRARMSAHVCTPASRGSVCCYQFTLPLQSSLHLCVVIFVVRAGGYFSGGGGFNEVDEDDEEDVPVLSCADPCARTHVHSCTRNRGARMFISLLLFLLPLPLSSLCPRHFTVRVEPRCNCWSKERNCVCACVCVCVCLCVCVICERRCSCRSKWTHCGGCRSSRLCSQGRQPCKAGRQALLSLLPSTPPQTRASSPVGVGWDEG